MKRLVLIAMLVACGDDGNHAGTDAAPPEDGATADAPSDDCFAGTPVTNEEIINACTPDSVVKIRKDSHPPLLNADGSLPPLPP